MLAATYTHVPALHHAGSGLSFPLLLAMLVVVAAAGMVAVARR